MQGKLWWVTVSIVCVCRHQWCSGCIWGNIWFKGGSILFFIDFSKSNSPQQGSKALGHHISSNIGFNTLIKQSNNASGGSMHVQLANAVNTM